jgi:hypothetical protein
LAEKHTLALKQHCYFNVRSTADEKLVGQMVTTAVLPLLPEKPRYP